MARSGTPIYWPTMTDYQEAVQSPKTCFADSELSRGAPVLNKLGLPRPICGQFASVYELENGGARWAVKCFLRNIPDLHNRYAKISDHLSKCDLPYFVTFDYLKKGIRIRGNYYPIVKMEWVEGLALNHFIERIVSDPTTLGQMEERWLALLEDLQSVDVAHGDLQHGNVLVADDGSLRLIDYDGMWVPKLKGQTSHETGHPNFQSPLRTGNDFNSGIDEFAGDVILVAMRALARDPGLWRKYDNGDNLLFRRQDLLDPTNSSLFAEVRSLGDDEIESRVETLIEACGAGSRRGRFGLRFKPKRARARQDEKPARPEKVKGWKGKKKKEAATPAPPPPRATAVAVSPPQAKPQPPAPPPVRPKAKKKAPPPAPKPAPPSPPSGTGTWLDDHVSGTGTAATRPALRGRKASAGKGIVGKLRIAIHICLLGLVAAVFITQIVTIQSGSGDQSAAILMPAFGTATLLGLVSFGSLFVLRSIHRTVSTLFFGLSGLITLGNICSKLLTTGASDWRGDHPLQFALMISLLVLSATGLVVELVCHRMGLVTRWRAP